LAWFYAITKSLLRGLFLDLFMPAERGADGKRRSVFLERLRIEVFYFTRSLGVPWREIEPISVGLRAGLARLWKLSAVTTYRMQRLNRRIETAKRRCGLGHLSNEDFLAVLNYTAQRSETAGESPPPVPGSRAGRSGEG